MVRCQEALPCLLLRILRQSGEEYSSRVKAVADNSSMRSTRMQAAKLTFREFSAVFPSSAAGRGKRRCRRRSPCTTTTMMASFRWTRWRDTYGGLSRLYIASAKTRQNMSVDRVELGAITAEQCFEEADLSHDGRISFSEFARWYTMPGAASADDAGRADGQAPVPSLDTIRHLCGLNKFSPDHVFKVCCACRRRWNPWKGGLHDGIYQRQYGGYRRNGRRSAPRLRHHREALLCV